MAVSAEEKLGKNVESQDGVTQGDARTCALGSDLIEYSHSRDSQTPTCGGQVSAFSTPHLSLEFWRYCSSREEG